VHAQYLEKAATSEPWYKFSLHFPNQMQHVLSVADDCGIGLPQPNAGGQHESFHGSGNLFNEDPSARIGNIT